jgi:hypothetical protein
LSAIAVAILHSRPGPAEPHSHAISAGGAKRIFHAIAIAIAIDGHYRIPGAAQDAGRNGDPVTASADRLHGPISGQPVDGIDEVRDEAQDRAPDNAGL